MRKLVRVLVSLIALVALTGPSVSQQPVRHKIGWLKLQDATHAPDRLKSFVDRLRELGQIEGTNFTIEARFADGDGNMLRPLAEELVRAGVDIIVATGQPALDAAYSVTRTVPIVARMSDDPVKRGMARSLASPEGNVTGIFSHFEEMAALRITQINRAVPDLRKVGVLLTLQHGDTAYWLTQARGAALKLGLETYVMNVNREADLEVAFARARENGVGGFVAFRSPVVASFDRRVIELSNSHQMPGIFDARDYVESGGFMSFGPNVQTVFRELAPYVARILRGDAPATLPIVQAGGIELVINRRAARAFGFAIPAWVVSNANLIIE